ncbi:Hydroxyethylthiazole kinase [Rickenella mellea]|uniref:Hydroxyethylthiazole kinase n=1 Tax=Rickenella mellea TaxID=50990 RepID=A0A4Y7Q986_9AGAM|nr:Hydroxyethylthiazole kinase [Rickenella mellea]
MPFIPKHSVDYSLYLVTGRDLVPPGHDYYHTVEEAVKGGVTIVQIREKKCDTGEFIAVAQKTKEICHRHGIPIIVNDRIDVALAIGADGVHLGQTDMPVSIARSLLPEGSIIGVSCNTPGHSQKAREDGADYIGIGAVWGTQTKQLTEPIIGVRGVGEVLDSGVEIKAVAIGGITTGNVSRTLHGSVSVHGKALEGVAVVSEIMASTTPQQVARRLFEIVHGYKLAPRKHLQNPFRTPLDSSQNIVNAAASLLSIIRKSSPLIHQITNNVVVNQSANATLALGASPIMATAAAEMQDLSQVSGALLVNFGTIGDVEGMLEAGRCANATRKPIVFDPVAVGATQHRRTIANELMNAWQATVIKGNAAEIGALADSTEVQSRGVDSVGEGFADPASMVKALARKERCIVVMSGPVDYVSDGETTVKLSNGHELLGRITGSGCMLGTCIATFCAASNLLDTTDDPGPFRLVKGDMIIGAVGGILALNAASEYAAVRQDVRGTGTFLPALIDELYGMTPEKLVSNAKVELC